MVSVRSVRVISAAVAAALVVGVSGCVRETVDNGERIFQFELWLPLVALLGGFALIPVGWMLRSVWARLGWGLLLLGPIAALGFAPSLFMEKSVVRPDGFEVHTGIWGLTAGDSANFADISRIRITAETSRTRRGGKSTTYYLNCDRKSGGSGKFPMGSDVTKAAAVAILEAAREHGIPIEDRTGAE